MHIIYWGHSSHCPFSPHLVSFPRFCFVLFLLSYHMIFLCVLSESLGPTYEREHLYFEHWCNSLNADFSLHPFSCKSHDFIFLYGRKHPMACLCRILPSSGWAPRLVPWLSCCEVLWDTRMCKCLCGELTRVCGWVDWEEASHVILLKDAECLIALEMSADPINTSPCVLSPLCTAKWKGEPAEGTRSHFVNAGWNKAEPDGTLPASVQGSRSESGTDSDPRQVLGLRLPAFFSNFGERKKYSWWWACFSFSSQCVWWATPLWTGKQQGRPGTGAGVPDSRANHRSRPGAGHTVGTLSAEWRDLRLLPADDWQVHYWWVNREHPPVVGFLLKFWRCLESRAWPCLLAFSNLASPGSFLEREFLF